MTRIGETIETFPKVDFTLNECRPEVKAFALLMERELRANDHKTGWKHMSDRWLYARLQKEVGELDDVRKWNKSRSGYRDGLASECADVANFAMMIADVHGCLLCCPAGDEALQSKDAAQLEILVKKLAAAYILDHGVEALWKNFGIFARIG